MLERILKKVGVTLYSIPAGVEPVVGVVAVLAPEVDPDAELAVEELLPAMVLTIVIPAELV
jgi:hypothetical protein